MATLTLIYTIGSCICAAVWFLLQMVGPFYSSGVRNFIYSKMFDKLFIKKDPKTFVGLFLTHLLFTIIGTVIMFLLWPLVLTLLLIIPIIKQ